MMSRKLVNKKRQKATQKTPNSDSNDSEKQPAEEVGKKENLSPEEAQALDGIDLLDDELDDADDLHPHIGEMPSLEPDARNDKKPKRKTKKSKSTKKKKTVTKNDESKKIKSSKPTKDQKKRNEKLLREAIAEAKRDFEADRAAVLDQVPSKVQDMFGQVGFGKWGKNMLPVLILGPYTVPPGQARDTWMEMFNKMQENGRPLEKMPYLVFWYGEINPKDFYSIIPQSNFIPYEKAPSKMLNYATKAEAKRDKGVKLATEDKQKIRAMEQLQEDLKKDPGERRQGDITFQEGYQMLTMRDVEELIDAENGQLSTDEDDDVVSDKDDESIQSMEKSPEVEEDLSVLEDSENEELDFVEEKSSKKKKSTGRRKSTAKASSSSTKKRSASKGVTSMTSTDNVVRAAEELDKANDKAEEEKVSVKKRKRPSKVSSKSTSEDGHIGTGTKGGKTKLRDKKKPKINATEITHEDEKSVGDDDISGKGPEEDVELDSERPAKKRKKGKGSLSSSVKKKKGKKVAKSDEEYEIDDDEEEEDDARRSTTSKSKKSRRKQDDLEDNEQVDGDDSSDEVDKRKRKKLRRSRNLENGENDASVEEQTSKKSTKKAKKLRHDGEEGNDETETRDKTMIGNAELAFRKNEEEFEPVLRKWRSAIEHKAVEDIDQCLSEILSGLSTLCARFIEIYNIAFYLKESKAIFKQRKAGLDRYQELRKSIKEHYDGAKKNLPSFKPVINFPDLLSPINIESTSIEPNSSQKSKSSVPQNGEDVRTYDESVSEKDKKEASVSISNGEGQVRDQIVKAKTQDSHSTGDVQSATDANNRIPKKGDKDLNVTQQDDSNWMKSLATVDTSDSQRLLALEFLREMALHFPDKEVEVDSVAIHVERALFSWADSTVSPKYWERLHVVISGICGEVEPGPIMRELLEGKIKNPEDLIKCSEEKLSSSFFSGEAGREARGDE